MGVAGKRGRARRGQALAVAARGALKSGARLEALESRLLLHAGHEHPAVAGPLLAPAAPAAAYVAQETCGCSVDGKPKLDPHELAELNTPPQSPPAGPTVTPAATGDPLLPDIFPWASEENDYFYGSVVTDGTTLPGRTLLEFSAAIANQGQGPMWLQGGTVNGDGTQNVMQRIFREGGGFTERLAGTFTYHAAHSHIHFDDYGSYKLRQVLPGNGVGPEVATGAKISFCLIDVDQYNLSLPNARPTSTPSPFGCGQTQGISVGWADVYGRGTDGQWIDVTNVPDGQYWLEVSVDVNNRLMESDETNNTVRILINLDKPSPDPAVRDSSPDGTSTTPVSAVSFDFDEAMNPSSFSPADDVASFTGPGGVDLRSQITGFSWSNGNTTLQVNFSTRTTDGAYSMAIGPQILSADNAHAMDQDGDEVVGEVPQDRYTANFSINLPNPNPAVVASRPAGGTLLPLSYVEFDFNEPMNASSFSPAADIATFTGPGGADLRPQVTGFTWTDADTLRVNFTPQTGGGSYTMVVGPQILANDNGNPMDQDDDGATGEAIQDRYTATFGGSDAFGYVGYAAPFDTVNLAPGGAGVVNSGIAGDDTATTINLGTNTFNFYGQNYTGIGQVFVSSNGLITFGAGNSEYSNGDLASVPSQRTIAVLWDDWDLTATGGGTVLYKLEDTGGTAAPDRLIIEWDNVPHYSGSTTNKATFQAILQLNTGATPGAIVLNYPDADAGDASYNNGASATVGIKDTVTTGGNRLLLSQNNGAGPVATGRALRIVKGPLPTVTAAAFDHGAVPPVLRYTFSANVSASLGTGDLTVQRLSATGAGAGTVAATGVTYDTGTNTATFTFAPGALTDANYRATLNGLGVFVAGSAAPLLADKVMDFFCLTGDINHDRFVNTADFTTLAFNFGKSGQTYDKGDLNGDTHVDSGDFVIFASNFGRQLPAVQSSLLAPASVGSITAAPAPAPAAKATPRNARRLAPRAKVRRLADPRK